MTNCIMFGVWIKCSAFVCLYKLIYMSEDMKAVTHSYLVTLFKLHEHRVVYLIITELLS